MTVGKTNYEHLLTLEPQYYGAYNSHTYVYTGTPVQSIHILIRHITLASTSWDDDHVTLPHLI